MKTTLKDISSIYTGLFAKPISEGEVVYLQAKHFDENRVIKQFLRPEIKADYVTEKHLLRQGDILFSAKGTNNFAALFENENKPVVASTTFFVIRLHEKIQKKILPEFLVWLINHPVSQKFLKGNAIGTSMVSISKVVLGELEISIPPVKTQKAILQISNLYKVEKKLKQQIQTLREQQIQQQIINSINL